LSNLPTTVFDNPIDVLQVEPSRGNEVQSVGIVNGYEPPTTTITEDQNDNVEISTENGKEVNVSQKSTDIIEFDKRVIKVDYKDNRHKYEVKPRLRINNHGMIAVLEEESPHTVDQAMKDQPFTIGEGQKVRKIEE